MQQSNRMYPGSNKAKDDIWNKEMRPYTNGNGLIICLASPYCGDLYRALALGIDTKRRLVLVDNNPSVLARANFLYRQGKIHSVQCAELLDVVLKHGREVDVVLADYCQTVPSVKYEVAHIVKHTNPKSLIMATCSTRGDGMARGRPPASTPRQKGARRAIRTQWMDNAICSVANSNKRLDVVHRRSYTYNGANGSLMQVIAYGPTCGKEKLVKGRK